LILTGSKSQVYQKGQISRREIFDFILGKLNDDIRVWSGLKLKMAKFNRRFGPIAWAVGLLMCGCGTTDLNSSKPNIANALPSVNCTSVKICFNLAIEMEEKGDRDQAIAAYGKSIELDPKNVDSYNNRGNLFADQGNWDRAIADYDSAIAINPNDAELYFNRAHVLGEKEDRDRAIKDYSQALKLNPKYTEAYANRAGEFVHLKKWDQAITDSNQAIALDPTLAEAYNHLGTSYLNQRDQKKAILNFQKVLQLNPPSDMKEYAERMLNILIEK
jgi:tetratricopeptide (TPR) repeat protein